MEKFENLPDEKQNTIIDAALKIFATNGYKKASISDIATKAGISKAMVFHYFGTKKELYLYLIRLCYSIITNEINENFNRNITDFFERITLASDIKIAAMKKHTAILAFLTSIYFETDEEVRKDIEVMLAEGEEFRNHLALDDLDTSKFKENIDVNLVMKMLVWMAEGFSNDLNLKGEFDLDTMCKEFYKCLDLLKENLYKTP
ncbi:TetR/AcrR family transcriptional regulator [Anaerocolumna chitinilytica]|uniref:TetR family transcriptional regulator n=1 Tax=Anaerocolumna chitinilytica TaxID=1727145 RepID=A0A7I8DPI5_9FIRM|nr:TetR/AcrR family transcriptional regulator [Anaerocolumna chitinilytica]BCK00321.1 TetR family transcriptional regulator [Anaerocolumna chitinilytica]